MITSVRCDGPVDRHVCVVVVRFTIYIVEFELHFVVASQLLAALRPSGRSVCWIQCAPSVMSSGVWCRFWVGLEGGWGGRWTKAHISQDNLCRCACSLQLRQRPMSTEEDTGDGVEETSKLLSATPTTAGVAVTKPASVNDMDHGTDYISPEEVPWGEILGAAAVWALGFSKFGFYYSFFLVVTWLPSYLHEMGMEQSLAAYMSAVPFAVTVPFVILFGVLAHTMMHRGVSKAVTRKFLATTCFTANIGCFYALTTIPVGKPWAGFTAVVIMYAFNASFIAGVAVNVIDIGAKYAGSIMALTHIFATGAGFLSSVITGALVTKRGHYERAFMVAVGVNVVSLVCFLFFAKFEPIFEVEESKRDTKMSKEVTEFSKQSVWKYWPRRWNIMLFCFMADLICYMDRANISATMIPMAKKYGWSKKFEGVCFGVFFLGLMSSHLVGGYLSDRYGAKNVLIFGVIWWSLFTILTPPSAVHPWLIVLVRFLMGTGEGVNFPAVYSLFSEWFPEDEEDVLVTITENGVYVGIVIAMLCVPFIELHMGWEPVFYIFGSLGFVWAALFAVYGGSSPRDLCYEDKECTVLTHQMDPKEVLYIEATRTKGPGDPMKGMAPKKLD